MCFEVSKIFQWSTCTITQVDGSPKQFDGEMLERHDLFH